MSTPDTSTEFENLKEKYGYAVVALSTTRRTLERVAEALYKRIATCKNLTDAEGTCQTCAADLKLLEEIYPEKYSMKAIRTAADAQGTPRPALSHASELPWDINAPIPTEPNLRELIFEAYNNATAHGLHDNATISCQRCGSANKIPEELTTALKNLLVVSEVVEAFEDVRSGTTGTCYEHKLSNGDLIFSSEFIRDGKPGKPMGYLSELADVVIRVADEVGRWQSTDEFVQVLREKLVYNRTRPFKHGKKC